MVPGTVSDCIGFADVTSFMFNQNYLLTTVKVSKYLYCTTRDSREFNIDFCALARYRGNNVAHLYSPLHKLNTDIGKSGIASQREVSLFEREILVVLSGELVVGDSVGGYMDSGRLLLLRLHLFVEVRGQEP